MRSYKIATVVLSVLAAGPGCETEPSPSAESRTADAGDTGPSATTDQTNIGTGGLTSPPPGTPTANNGDSTDGDSNNGVNASVPNSGDVSAHENDPTDAGTIGTSESDTDDTGPSAGCDFVVSTAEVSPQMPTVGIVEWSLGGRPPTSAKISFELTGVSTTLLNVGGEAPVNLDKPNYRTLLLGLKQNSDYTFRIQAVRDGQNCTSETFVLPQTGSPAGAPTDFKVTVDRADARTPGFILTTGGYRGTGAYILDADGAVVWYATGPSDPGRIHMDYEGENVWMMSLNPIAANLGKLQYLSMDGQTGDDNVSGFLFAHHDFAVMPGGKLATMVWRENGDPLGPESDLVIRSSDGTLTTAFKIGSNLYNAERYHSNAIHYIPEDDSFTISDRNQNLVVKVSSIGEVQWQLGGSCVDAPVGAGQCFGHTWLVNHGHHLLFDGTFVLFVNNSNGEGDPSRVLEFHIQSTAEGATVVPVKDYVGTEYSSILGDVQRLPNGNTLITYSTAGRTVEVDPAWNVVQTFEGTFGYAEWRPTLYGPPARL